MDAFAYRDALLSLQPPGMAFSRDPESVNASLMLALGDLFAALDARFAAVIEEADPRTTLEMLPDWERFLGLPDPVIPPPATVADRRAAVAARLLSRFGVSKAAFIALAASLGVAATITTHVALAADVGAAGDIVYDLADTFWWEMTLTVPVGTAPPLVALERFVERVTPDHTVVTFNYLFA